VATALAALVMVAMMGILRNLTVQQRVLLERAEVRTWRLPLVQQLRWDVANARRMAFLSGELHLTGYSARDFKTGQPTQRPTEITYFIVGSEHRNWLVRRETHSDDITNRNARSELVLAGVSRMDVHRVDGNGRLQPVSTRLGPVSDRLQLQLYGDQDNYPIMDETIYVRWEVR